MRFDMTASTFVVNTVPLALARLRTTTDPTVEEASRKFLARFDGKLPDAFLALVTSDKPGSSHERIFDAMRQAGEYFDRINDEDVRGDLVVLAQKFRRSAGIAGPLCIEITRRLEMAEVARPPKGGTQPINTAHIVFGAPDPRQGILGL
jgi:hypothetical protein